MSKVQYLNLRRMIKDLEHERDDAQTTVKHLEAELAASEEGRMMLWKIIKIMTASAERAVK